MFGLKYISYLFPQCLFIRVQAWRHLPPLPPGSFHQYLVRESSSTLSRVSFHQGLSVETSPSPAPNVFSLGFGPEDISYHFPSLNITNQGCSSLPFFFLVMSMGYSHLIYIIVLTPYFKNILLYTSTINSFWFPPCCFIQKG